MRRRLVPIMVLLAGLVACGGGRSGISDTAAAQLGPHVARIRAAAGDPPAASAELDGLRVAVDELRRTGELSEAAAARVLAAGAEVEARLAGLTPPPTTTWADTTTSTPPGDEGDAPDGGRPPGEVKGKAKGRDKDHG